MRFQDRRAWRRRIALLGDIGGIVGLILFLASATQRTFPYLASAANAMISEAKSVHIDKTQVPSNCFEAPFPSSFRSFVTFLAETDICEDATLYAITSRHFRHVLLLQWWGFLLYALSRLILSAFSRAKSFKKWPTIE